MASQLIYVHGLYYYYLSVYPITTCIDTGENVCVPWLNETMSVVDENMKFS